MLVNDNLRLRLIQLRSDYSQVKGYPFTYFFCPILFKDENVSLCKGHIINLAFPNSARDWVIQRKEVDGFFGSNFEADFVSLKYKETQTLGDVITDRTLFSKFQPKILANDKPVDFFVARGDIPKDFTHVEFDNDGQIVHLGIKMPPNDFLAASEQKWEIAIEKDIRISAMVSLIKSAHLTLFALLGYRYALSSGGYFVGRQILGEFFQQNYGKPKSEVHKNAHSFFREFMHMVRPIQSPGPKLQGTITDKFLFICEDNNSFPWAVIVLIRTSQQLNAVMIPLFEQPNAVVNFLDFLHDESDFIEVKLACFEQDEWKVDKKSKKLYWPKDGILYP